ncbi:hypothetical protein PHLGIDRAFT_113180 [Phlebiopsis gigantea 11061_1 CR5-6]|uniref:BTB domain-containing protein n=1 Tax=Phlebiopsis gigantea (strain 11061_1 CR5-6) TaxID=745531 RepID=A0A0C3RYH2_PHLG1|nr:hypothetical protein PHLGIDRAFT_113180 [Phlebiopsis gigantea 11061_1 CR5-6]
MVSQPSSPSLVNASSPAALQNHIYAAFLDRRTADVALHVHGSWHAIYKLHRVVLIQAGFFQSLFTSGFAESKVKLTSHRLGPDVVDIVLEDPNITRAAFEVCIAYLYGGGPELYVSPLLIPTAKQPLTPVFPADASSSDAFYLSGCPPDQHPASPRFLLSLLAASVFLSITPIATQAMSFILTTIGPYTVGRYLNFALGRGIGDSEGSEPDAAVGLEGVAEIISDEEAVEPDLDTIHGRDVRKEAPSEADSSAYSIRSLAYPEAEQHFFYGVVSDKIGEAAACWLARWGIDMLHHELQLEGKEAPELIVSPHPVVNRRRASTVPGPFPSGPNAARAATSDPTPSSTRRSVKHKIPLIWRRGGLTARWVRGLLSSDTLFIPGEKDRFDAARRVVELRRAEGILDEEEVEYAILFTQGIYYANMNLDELMMISKDVSPTTGKPFVPITVLQSAHWDQSVLRHSITTSRSGPTSSPPSSPSPSGPSPTTKELGVTMTSAELANCIRSSPTKALHPSPCSAIPYFPVPSDSSQRIGDNSGIEGASLEHLFDGTSPLRSPDGATVTIPCSEERFFGIEQQSRPLSSFNTPDKTRWSPYPPYRFSVEFWDVETLKEKSRLHSRTIWYAGSLWNVYVQIVRKKGIQLGVYLHRQSTIDPIPPSSTPVVLPSESSTPSSPLRRENSQQPLGVPLHQTLSTPVQYAVATPVTSRSGTPHSTPSTPAIITVPATAPPTSPPQPYRDPRSAISAYFTIACAGSTGSSITRFSSSPDVFSVSQSWGWKSSSLRTGDHSEQDGDGILPDNVAAGKNVSLRATVMLGLV